MTGVQTCALPICKANGMNESGIGIALVGNFTQDCPTPAQLDSLAYLLQTLCTYYKIPACNVKGHRDVDGANTQCPGARFPWSNVRNVFPLFEGFLPARSDPYRSDPSIRCSYNKQSFENSSR